MRCGGILPTELLAELESNPATALSTKFSSRCRCRLSLNSLENIFTGSTVHLHNPALSSPRGSHSSSAQVCPRGCRDPVATSGSTSNSGSLAFPTTSAVTGSAMVLNPSRSSTRAGIAPFRVLFRLLFWPLPMHGECSPRHLECESFPEVFSALCPGPSEDNYLW